MTSRHFTALTAMLLMLPLAVLVGCSDDDDVHPFIVLSLVFILNQIIMMMLFSK